MISTDTTTSQAPRAAERRLVGREGLIDRIHRELVAAHPVSLRGEPGVGKSRVLAELADGHPGPVAAIDGTSLLPGEHATPSVRTPPEGDQPLLVLVDDAHLLPRIEVARLHALTRQPWSRVVTAVPTAIGSAACGATAELGSWWQGEAWRCLEVAPLDRSGTAALIEEHVGGLPEPQLVHEVWRITGGHPIAIAELLADAVDTGCVAPGADSWRLVSPLPLRRVAALLGDRLSGLSEEAMHDLQVLAFASPVPIRAASCLFSPHAVQELEARGLVRFRAGRRGRLLTIVDALHAEVVRSHLLAPERREVLTEVAEAFDRLGVGGRRRLELASWRLEVGGWDLAHLGDAAQLAHREGDPHLAVRLSQAAVAAGAGAEVSRVGAVATVEACAGTPLDPTTGLAGCAPRGDDEVAAALALAPATTADTPADALVAAHREAIGEGRWEAAADALLTHPAAPGGELQAYAALFRALGGDPAGAARTLEAHELAVPSAEDLPTSAEEARQMLVVSLAHATIARDAGRIEDLRVAAAGVEVASDAAHGTVIPMATHLVRGYELLLDIERPLGSRIRDAAAGVDRGLRHLGAETAWWYAVEGWLRWEAGDLAGARSRLVSATLAARGADPIRLRPRLLADLAVLAAETGSALEAEWRLDQIGPDRGTNPIVAHRCELAELLVQVTRNGGTAVGAGLLALATSAREAGRSWDALTTLHRIARVECDRPSARRAVRGISDLQGLPRAGELSAHVRAWAAGDATALADAARDLAREGVLLLAAEAAAQAGRAGAGATVDALADALATGCTDAGTYALDGRSTVEISPRRRDAAVLAMAGLDGRAIATELGVSVRTVENHLAKVYRQVGVSGRQELTELFEPGVAPFDGATPLA